MKFSIKDFFSKCDLNLVTFTEEILIGKLYFLYSAVCQMFLIECLKFKLINKFCLIFGPEFDTINIFVFNLICLLKSKKENVPNIPSQQSFRKGMNSEIYGVLFA